MLQDTLETGRIIKKMVLVFNSTKTVTNTRVYGKEINAMAKVLIGGMKMESSEESTQETGLKIKNTVEAPSFTKMEIDTMDIGSQECLKERAVWFTLMKIFMRVNGMRVNAKDTVSLQKEMATILKVTGLMIWEKVRAVISITIRTSFSLESGSMISLRQGCTLK